MRSPAAFQQEACSAVETRTYRRHLPPEAEAKLNDVARRIHKGTDELLDEAVDVGPAPLRFVVHARRKDSGDN